MSQMNKKRLVYKHVPSLHNVYITVIRICIYMYMFTPTNQSGKSYKTKKKTTWGTRLYTKTTYVMIVVIGK